jgi:hypothetical protein
MLVNMKKFVSLLFKPFFRKITFTLLLLHQRPVAQRLPPGNASPFENGQPVTAVD